MEDQTKQILTTIPTEISEGFWSFKGHYFGETTFYNDHIAFGGNRRNFSLKKIPLTFEIPLNEVGTIQFSNSRLMKVKLKNGTKRVFMLGQGEINEYGSASAANMLASAVARGAGDSLYQIARSKNNEKLMQSLYDTLRTNPSYSALITGEASGVKTSTLHRNYLIARVVIPIIFIAIAAFLVLRNINKL